MSRIAKKASAAIPHCKDQSIPYLVGAGQSGINVQMATATFATGGVFKFADLKMQAMADTSYVVLAFSNAGAISGSAGTRTNTQFTLTGPSAGDPVTFLVIGRMVNQPPRAF